MDFPIYSVGDKVILRPDIQPGVEYTNNGIRPQHGYHGMYLVIDKECLPFAGEELTIAYVDDQTGGTDNGLVYYTCEETGGGEDVFGSVWYVGGMFSGPSEPMTEISVDVLDEILVL